MRSLTWGSAVLLARGRREWGLTLAWYTAAMGHHDTDAGLPAMPHDQARAWLHLVIDRLPAAHVQALAPLLGFVPLPPAYFAFLGGATPFASS